MTELKAEAERCCRCCEGSVAAVAALLQLCCSCCSSAAEWCCHCCHMRSADCGGTSWSERLQYATASASLEQRIWTTWQRYPCASARRRYVSYSQCWQIFYGVSFCTFVPGKKEEIRLVLPMLAYIHIASVLHFCTRKASKLSTWQLVLSTITRGARVRHTARTNLSWHA